MGTIASLPAFAVMSQECQNSFSLAYEAVRELRVIHFNSGLIGRYRNELLLILLL